MPGKIDAARRLAYHNARWGDGMSQKAAAEASRVSKSWAHREDHAVKNGLQQNLAHGYTRANGNPSRMGKRKEILNAAAKDMPPMELSDISSDAQRQLEDFHYFCRVQFGVVETPWRRAAFARVMALWETTEKEYAVVNAPPGIGKSKLFIHDIPAWLTVRDRHIRGLIGSASQRLATRYTRRLRTSFERRYPLEAAELDKKLGLGADATDTMIGAFGRFRSPEVGQLWQADQFEVELVNGFDTGEKEPTWQSYGRDAEQLGNRVNFVGWDDLVTRKTLAITRSEDFVEWFTDEAETRLEPGGLFLLQGQRIDAVDLYRNRLDAVAIDLDDAGNEVRSKKYHHFIFPAHISENCTGDHGKDATPADFDHDTGKPVAGTGCLLDPIRQTWTELAQIKAASPRKYGVLYLQEDVSEGTKLVSHLWVHGGESTDGEIHPGCLDFDRNILQAPSHLHRDCPSIASVDPSASRKWAVEWWLNEPKFDIDHLMDLYKGELTAGELLSYNVSSGEFYGIMHDWQMRSVKLGRKITHWVIEANVQQKFLIQHGFVHEWTKRMGVTIVAHQTHSHNKQDADHGFWAMRNQWKLGKIRLPYADESAHVVQPLIDEALLWPSAGMSDDALMGYWMYRIKVPMIGRVQQAPMVVTAPAPSWLR